MAEMMQTALAYGYEDRDFAFVTYVSLSPRDEFIYEDGNDGTNIRAFGNPNFKCHWGL